MHALPETIAILKKNLFNWDVWPDFTVIPNAEEPWLQYAEVKIGDVIKLDDRRITVLPAVHTVPAVGYMLDSGRSIAIDEAENRLHVQKALMAKLIQQVPRKGA